MEDARIWEMEAELWHGGAEVYERLIDDDVVMALPEDPFVYSREAAIAAVTNTPGWDSLAVQLRPLQPGRALVLARSVRGTVLHDRPQEQSRTPDHRVQRRQHHRRNPAAEAG